MIQFHCPHLGYVLEQIFQPYLDNKVSIFKNTVSTKMKLYI